MPEVSFVMPIYAVEAYLNKCVDSILCQTFTDFELILVDDGSPDHCGEICDEYVKKDKRVKVIHKPNGGVAAARNDGIQAAVGKWVYVVDSDDWLEPDALEKMYSAAVKNKVDVVISDCIAHYPSKPKRGRMFSKPFVTRDRKVIDSIQRFFICHKHSPYPSDSVLLASAPWSKLVRMDIAKQENVYFDPYVKGRFDDGLWSLRVFEHAQSVGYIDEVTYNWRYVAGSQTNAFRPQAMDVMERGFERTVDFIREFQKDNTFYAAHYARVVNFLALQLSQYFFNPNNPMSKKERRVELRKVIGEEPYVTALKNVAWKDLEWKHVYTTLCAKTKWIYGLEMYAWLKNRARKV